MSQVRQAARILAFCIQMRLLSIRIPPSSGLGVGLFVLMILAVFLGSISFGQTPLIYKGKPEQLPREVAPQPIPFSHRLHVSSGIACKGCHSGADSSERAGLPRLQKCMLCHSSIKAESAAIRKLSTLAEEGQEAAWVRVYQLPDFVFFSHASHSKAEVECGKCHGPVEMREVLSKEISTSMETCMNCHLARQASTDCHLCHELGE